MVFLIMILVLAGSASAVKFRTYTVDNNNVKVSSSMRLVPGDIIKNYDSTGPSVIYDGLLTDTRYDIYYYGFSPAGYESEWRSFFLDSEAYSCASGTSCGPYYSSDSKWETTMTWRGSSWQTELKYEGSHVAWLTIYPSGTTYLVNVLDPSAPNVAPTMIYLPDVNLDEDDGFSNNVFDIKQFVSDDNDLVTDLTFGIVENNPGIVTCSLDVNLMMDCTTQTNQNGVSTVTVTATDSNALSTSKSFDVTVSSVDDNPQVSGIPDQTINEGQSFATFDLDIYLSEFDGDSITWTSSSSTLNVNIDGNNVVTVTAPNVNWNGQETITFKAEDQTGNKLFGTDLVTFTINAVDDTPSVSGISDQTINEGQSFTTFDLDSYLTELDGDSIAWSNSGNVQLLVNIDGNNVVTVTAPNADWNGQETITFTATDITGNSYSNSDSAIFRINPINDAPTKPTILTYTGGVYGGTNNIISVTCSGSTDVDGDGLTYAYLVNNSGSFQYYSFGQGSSVDINVSKTLFSDDKRNLVVACESNDGTLDSELLISNIYFDVDKIDPVISLTGSNPQTIEVHNAYSELGATASDNYFGDITGDIIIDTSNVNINLLGSYSVDYDVTDSVGNIATQKVRTINIVDTTIPTITLVGANPQVLEINTAYSELGATASDNYDGVITGSISIDTSDIDMSTVGTYTVTYDVTDANSNDAVQVTRTISVVDTTAPVITVVGDQPQTVEINTPYVEQGATVIDNSLEVLSAIIDSSAVDITTVGSYTVTYNVDDSEGNSATEQTRTVNVVDTTIPVITMTGANPQTIEVHNSYSELGATITDNSLADLSGSLVIDASAVDTNTVGSYSVTYNVDDASGNSAAEETRTVNVVDTTIPVITLVGANPQTLEVDTAYVELGATALDNYDGNLTGSIVIDATAVQMDTLGTYTVTYNVVDANTNNAVEVTRDVTIVDTQIPVVTLVGANPQTLEVDTAYVELGATALDNYDGNLTGSIVTDATAVEMDTLGTYTVTYDVTDASGNVAVQVTRDVTIVDTQIPVITVTGADPQTIEVGVSYSELGATALDNYDGNITGSIVIDASAVDTNTVGSYSVTYNVDDASGNSAAEETRTVNVVDTTIPVITLVGANPQTLEVDTAYVELGATALDNYDGNLTGSIVIDATAVQMDTLGTYTVTYNVVDANTNNAVEVTRDVTIVDTQIPVVTLVGANPQTLEVDTAYVELGATALDNYDGNITGSIVTDATAVQMDTLGTYTVTYNVVDSEGNNAIEVTRDVTIVDTQNPTITLTGADPQTIELGTSYSELGATASDNYDGNITGSIVIDATGVDDSTVGSYSVTYNVDDASGNSAAEETRTVNIVDTTNPVLDGALVNQVSEYYSSLSYDIDVIDESTVDFTINDTTNFEIGLNTGILSKKLDSLAVGNYTVEITATDAESNANVLGSVVVSVVDTTSPIIDSISIPMTKQYNETFNITVTFNEYSSISDATITIDSLERNLVLDSGKSYYYEVQGNNLTAGNYDIDLFANDEYDNNNSFNYPSSLSIYGASNTAPNINVVSNTPLNEGDTISVNVTSTDPEGTTPIIKLYKDDVIVKTVTDTSLEYTEELTNQDAGTYVFYATSSDGLLTTTSNNINFVVNNKQLPGLISTNIVDSSTLYVKNNLVSFTFDRDVSNVTLVDSIEGSLTPVVIDEVVSYTGDFTEGGHTLTVTVTELGKTNTESYELDFTIDITATVNLNVTDASGNPISNVDVNVYKDSDDSLVQSTVTVADGSTLDAIILTEEEYYITLNKLNYFESTVNPLSVTGEDQSHDVTMNLIPDANVISLSHSNDNMIETQDIEFIATVSYEGDVSENLDINLYRDNNNDGLYETLIETKTINFNPDETKFVSFDWTVDNGGLVSNFKANITTLGNEQIILNNEKVDTGIYITELEDVISLSIVDLSGVTLPSNYDFSMPVTMISTSPIDLVGLSTEMVATAGINITSAGTQSIDILAGETKNIFWDISTGTYNASESVDSLTVTVEANSNVEVSTDLGNSGGYVTLACPADLLIIDENDNKLGYDVEGNFYDEIEGAYLVSDDGEKELYYLPENVGDVEYIVIARGEGSYDLIIEDPESDTQVISDDIPIKAKDVIGYDVSAEDVEILIDSDADGLYDKSVTTDETFEVSDVEDLDDLSEDIIMSDELGDLDDFVVLSEEEMEQFEGEETLVEETFGEEFESEDIPEVVEEPLVEESESEDIPEVVDEPLVEESEDIPEVVEEPLVEESEEDSNEVIEPIVNENELEGVVA